MSSPWPWSSISVHSSNVSNSFVWHDLILLNPCSWDETPWNPNHHHRCYITELLRPKTQIIIINPIIIIIVGIQNRPPGSERGKFNLFLPLGAPLAEAAANKLWTMWAIFKLFKWLNRYLVDSNTTYHVYFVGHLEVKDAEYHGSSAMLWTNAAAPSPFLRSLCS